MALVEVFLIIAAIVVALGVVALVFFKVVSSRKSVSKEDVSRVIIELTANETGELSKKLSEISKLTRDTEKEQKLDYLQASRDRILCFKIDPGIKRK